MTNENKRTQLETALEKLEATVRTSREVVSVTGSCVVVGLGRAGAPLNETYVSVPGYSGPVGLGRASSDKDEKYIQIYKE